MPIADDVDGFEPTVVSMCESFVSHQEQSISLCGEYCFKANFNCLAHLPAIIHRRQKHRAPSGPVAAAQNLEQALDALTWIGYQDFRTWASQIKKVRHSHHSSQCLWAV